MSDERRTGPFDRPVSTPRIEDPYRGMTAVEREHSIRLRTAEDKLLIIAGVDCQNGKLGETRKTVESHSSLIKAIGGAALAGVVTAATALYTAGVRSGTRDQQIEFLRAEVASLRSEVRELRAPSPSYRPTQSSALGDVP